MKFSIKDLVTFTEEILNEKFHLFIIFKEIPWNTNYENIVRRNLCFMKVKFPADLVTVCNNLVTVSCRFGHIY